MSADDVIRLASIIDLPILADIERAAAELFPDDVLPAEQRQHTLPQAVLQQAQREKRLWVAQDTSGLVVGFVLADSVGDWGWIQEISVHPQAGRQGIGRRLMATAIEWSRQRGCCYVGLTTFEGMAWNAPFYRRLGFRDFVSQPMPAFLRQALADERQWSRSPRVALCYAFGSSS
ncbi:GCN5 family N-acetyltransferase [Pragia fontium]|uniref:GCN5 family N-acetyltransferase n=1 Tax=Pragia fontium TaxID=82985 RepID=A0ABQ5LJC4_9GAMM|nr:GNAT family N-acetyltransferase [Pragia fontium]AKJ40748.1 hypothetical protein QQ39_00570 [Pragia fontium]GKX63685.1 GCN5 family N-acetyltransferase [Pragia fontium]